MAYVESVTQGAALGCRVLPRCGDARELGFWRWKSFRSAPGPSLVPADRVE
jgi:hypothetical protein